jgi:hypothetical protein
LTYLCGQNYGAFFDLTPTGVVGGPVQLIGQGNVVKDLSSNKWSYKVNFGNFVENGFLGCMAFYQFL